MWAQRYGGQMTKFELLEKILKNNNGFIKTADAVENNVSRTYFLEFVKINELIKVANGLYMSQDTWPDDLFVIQTRYPSAIFSHETATYLLDLTDREPFGISLTLPTGTSSTRLNKENINVYKIKRDLFELGLINVVTPSGNIVRTYNMERTFCDFVRNRNDIEIQEFQSYIKNYMQSKDKNIPKLMRYAKKLSVDKIIKQYMEVLL